MANDALDTIRTWLTRQLDVEQQSWFDAQLEVLTNTPSGKALHLAFGFTSRKLGRADLLVTLSELEAAYPSLSGCAPHNWSVDLTARVIFLVTASRTLNAWETPFASLVRHGDVAEQIACFSALPFLPDSDKIDGLVGEGLRTNMRAVFEAIAHNNPYPAERFDGHRWNHMVLKALFIGARLYPIIGLDKRANAELARILCDYANERWAAGRPVTPELWRCVGPFADGPMLRDLARAARDGTPDERAAVALALAAARAPEAAMILTEMPDEKAAIEVGALDWNTLASKLETAA